jgi:cell division protein FtsW
MSSMDFGRQAAREKGREIVSHMNNQFYVDKTLLLVTLCLMLIGLVMVTSASMDWAERMTSNRWHIAQREVTYIILALASGFTVFMMPMKNWRKLGGLALVASFVLLIAVFLPVIGKTVNGSTRWIDLKFMNLQASEVAKISFVIFLASYLERRQKEVQTSFWGFLKPGLVLTPICLLLLKEPDFGATLVIVSTAGVMMFLGGVKAGQYAATAVVVAVLGTVIVFAEEYRVTRLMTFSDPWNINYVFNENYQLTQALIAFGQGEWFGQGLGASVQKLAYLPEAHTDFVFAILAEETGLVGSLVVVALYVLLIGRSMQIAFRAHQANMVFEAMLVYGISMLFAFQVLINMGVNTGLLPTKGLTLPFLSYGGSSLMICAGMIMMVQRVNHECRLKVAK